MEESSFIETFGTSPTVRVLDFFLTFIHFDYPIKQIAKEIEAGWTTVEEIVRNLLKAGILKETRKTGKSQMYALNRENTTVKVLLKLDFELSKAAAEQEIARQGIKIKA